MGEKIYGKVIILVIYYLGEQMLKKPANKSNRQAFFRKIKHFFQKVKHFSKNQAFFHQDSKLPR